MSIFSVLVRSDTDSDQEMSVPNATGGTSISVADVGLQSAAKAEACDFSSIIDSKLADIKMESFGREWLYDRLYEWIAPAPLAAPPQTLLLSQSQFQRQPKSLQSKVLLVTGEPVRSAVGDSESGGLI